jgi:uncharacterized protein YndB with AHSA1/START domain
MKILKGLLKFILGLIAVLLIVAIFIPREYTVSVSTTINKPKQQVFDYVKMLKNQEQFSVWVMQDTVMKVEYKGIDGTVGASSYWNSKNDNVGEGRQEIVKMTEGERIDVDLKFIRPMASNEKAATILKAISDTQTEVISEFYGHGSYPMNLLSFIGKGIIKDAEIKNLANLKRILENK